MTTDTSANRTTTIQRAVRAVLGASVVGAGLTAGSAAFAADTTTLTEIVVTGSIIRRTDIETPSPVTIISSESLAERGINTVAEAMQRISANNAGTIQQGWNTGFNFAAGANAPALRGLTVQSTLSIADGLRLAPYPLADDGQRNFVDLNTIPSAIIDRIEILRDGASSTYGADAIAGVVNVITKKEIQGLHIGGSGGFAEHSGGAEKTFDATYGFGDLEGQGFNFYVSAEYKQQEELWARDRGYPFNSTDWSGMCGPSGSCMANHNWNGVTAEDGTFNGLISVPGVALVRSREQDLADDDGDGNTAELRFPRYSYLNTSAGCRNWPTTTITASDSATSPLSICEVDMQNAYIMLQPEIERVGLSLRFTADLNERTQLYVMGNYYKTDTFASFTPLGFNGLPTPPRPATLASYDVILPVYVCSSGVGTRDGLNTGCSAANGSLNPYNPYAAQGYRAQILLRSPYGRNVTTSSRATRAAIGLDGSFGDDWRYTVNFTASEVGLTRTEGNYFIPQRIMDVVARGTFNFSDPYANSQEIWDYIAPPNKRYSPSRLWQVQGSLAKDLVDLGGGPLAVAIGASYRDESIVAPSGNPANDSAPYTRYYSINAVGTAGSRDVTSAFFEINAPVLEQLELVASGRHDDYSTGQSSFSPKVGFKFKPIKQLMVRGTYSEGFRIPSFNEAFGLPTTGYVNRTVNCTTYAAFCAAHGNNAYVTQGYSLGLTQTGNPSLDPEESEAFTFGLVFQPTESLSFTLDYWQIEVDGLITGVTDTSAAEAQYYANNGVVNIPGVNVLQGVPDPAFPNALPVIGFIETSYANQDSQEVKGVDFGANLAVPLGRFNLRSSVDVSYMQKYELTTDSGSVLRYDGTLSPCNITSCSGAPKWRGSWQNTLEYGDTTASLTVYYTSGYDTASIDFGGVKGDCQFNADNGASTASYVDGTPVNCRAKRTWNADLTVSHKFSDKFTVYADILNVLDIDAPFEPSAAYGLFGFNPAWAGPNAMGRYVRIGAKLKL